MNSVLATIHLFALLSGTFSLQEDHPPRRKDYSKYKVIRIIPQDEEELRLLHDLRVQYPAVDIWKEPRYVNSTMDISLAPDQVENIENVLKMKNVKWTTLVDDLQSVVNEEDRYLRRRRLKRSINFDINQYHRYNEIVDFLRSAASTYPNIAQVIEVGLSYENRMIYGIKIGTGTNKKAFYIDAGLHAREWMAPAVAVYLINRLVTTYKTDDVARSLVDNVDWYIIPCANPDGYEYTWNSDRYWRKTRSKHGKCFGVDANRNFDFHWSESDSSPNPCLENYNGPQAFSEKETSSMSNYMFSLRSRLYAYVALHSYGQDWLVPYGYAYDAYPADYSELLSVAQQAEEAVRKVHNNNYNVENSAQMYAASGSSDDWAKGVPQVKYSYTIELRPGIGTAFTNSGFNPPASEITPCGEEIFAGLAVVAKKLYDE